MAKVNKQGQHKPTAKNARPTGAQKNSSQSSPKSISAKSNAPTPTPTSTPASPADAANKNKQSDKARKSAIGGTAITGARSTIPKEIPTSGPAQDRPERYNRETRRRMEQMGTGPYNEPVSDPRRKRYEKRIEERKKRQEEVKKTVVSKGPSTRVKIGNKNTYFLLTAFAIVALIIIIAIIIRRPF